MCWHLPAVSTSTGSKIDLRVIVRPPSPIRSSFLFSNGAQFLASIPRFRDGCYGLIAAQCAFRYPALVLLDQIA